LFIASRKSTGHDFTRYYSRNNNELPSYTIKILITRIPSHLYILSNTIRVVRHSESYNLPISAYVLYTEGLSRLPSRWNKWPSWVNIYLALIVRMFVDTRENFYKITQLPWRSVFHSSDLAFAYLYHITTELRYVWQTTKVSKFEK